MKAALVYAAGLPERAAAGPLRVDDVIRCAMPDAEQGLNIARGCVFVPGLPCSAMTINLCSSGFQAIALAAERGGCCCRRRA